MTKIKINDKSGADETDSDVVSPTRYQMSKWIEQELQEAEQDKMLSDENPRTIFLNQEISSESID